ncbi:hypothetical protein BH23CHL2_BH23CHL2_31720 [soil metagenome]
MTVERYGVWTASGCDRECRVSVEGRNSGHIPALERAHRQLTSFFRCPPTWNLTSCVQERGESIEGETELSEGQVRELATRAYDARQMLEREVAAWVSSAGDDGLGYLVPLSYYWDGERMTFAAHPRSPTVVNLARAGWARVAIGRTRDVVIIEGSVDVFPVEGHDGLAALHAEATGFDTRSETEPYCFIQLTPETAQTWRNAAELPGRTVMRDGAWLA